MKDNETKFDRAMLPAPVTMRIRFRKVGNLQYISHLDLQRTFSRVLVRAGLPLWYTKGFNPHIKMVFGMPLPVGSESECEMLDVRIEREITPAEMKERLNAELTAELAVSEVYEAEHKFTEIGFAEYDFTIRTAGVDEALAARVRALLQTHPLTVTRKTKSGEREVDIVDFIKSAEVSVADGALAIRAVLAAGDGRYLSPELLITALRRHAGVLCGDPMQESYRILRRRVLSLDGESEFR